MKGLLLVLVLALSGLAIGQDGNVTVTVKFTEIEEGYDHLTRDVLYVDGKEVMVSEERLESKAIKFTMKVPRGQHTIKIVNWVLYEGTWEENNVANNYSIDAFDEIECKVKKKGKLTVVYALGEGISMTYK
jgi:hypothetical protein